MADQQNPIGSIPEYIEPPPAVIEEYKEKLVKHYQGMPKYKGDPLAKASQVIEACKAGWPFAPKTFEKRIYTKSHMGHPGANNLRTYGEVRAEKAAHDRAIEARYEEATEFAERTPAIEKVIDHLGREKFLKGLKLPDKKFFRQREAYYRREFEFNSSSDFSLLLEVRWNSKN
jgi:hypothetical protein